MGIKYSCDKCTALADNLESFVVVKVTNADPAPTPELKFSPPDKVICMACYMGLSQYLNGKMGA